MDFIANKIFLFLAFAAYLKPSGFDLLGYDLLNLFFNYLRIICAGMVCLQYILKRRRLSNLVIAEIIFFAIYILAYLFNGSSLRFWGVFAVSVITMSMLMDYCIHKNKGQMMISALFRVFFVLVAYNLFYVVKSEGWKLGFYRGIIETFSFLNSANGSASFFFSALVVAGVYSAYKGKKMSFAAIVLTVMVGATVLLFWSATSLIGYAIYISLLLFAIFRRNKKDCNISILVWGALAFYVSVTFFRIQNLFANVIEKYLHKTVTLTGRTTFWDRGIAGFMSSPILGLGEELLHIDNTFVRILYNGGLLLGIAFILMVCIAAKNAVVRSDRSYVTYLASSGLVAVIVMSIAEAWGNFLGFYIILELLYHSRRITRDIVRNLSIQNEVKKRKIRCR